VDRATERRALKGSLVYFAYMDTLEDLMTITVLRDTANEARLLTKPILMGQIGWDEDARPL
jgi:hypothetical protein